MTSTNVPATALLEQATEDDVNGLVTAATEQYERVLDTGAAPVEAYLSLACLYWQITDFGFYSHHKDIRGSLYVRAWDRCYEVLDDAEQHFPQHPEVAFWRRYFAWANLNEPFPDADCLRLVTAPGATLVPFFRLYQPPDPRFEAEARRLLADCEVRPTAKNRYVLLILRSKLRSTSDAGPGGA